jgi:hypothetical protein
VDPPAPLRRVPEGDAMTLVLLLAALSVAFLLVAATCEWLTARLGEPAPYTDRSRGTGHR